MTAPRQEAFANGGNHNQEPFITLSSSECTETGAMFHFVAPHTEADSGGMLMVTFSTESGGDGSTSVAESIDNNEHADWWVSVEGSGEITLLSASAGDLTWGKHGMEHATVDCGNGEVEPQIFDVCKVLEDNEDGMDDSGTFSFDVRWDDVTQQQIHLAATEGGEPVCETVTAPAEAMDIVVAEWTGTPAGFTQAAGYPMYTLDGGAAVSNGTAALNGAANVTFYNKADGEVAGEVPLEICKTVEDNGDGIADQGGTFRFDIRYNGAKQFDIAIDATEGTTSCEGVNVPADATGVEVVEWTNTPADFPMADGYPMHSLDGGNAMAGGTAAINGATSVTFHNRASGEVAGEVPLQICKTVEDNEDGIADQGGTFRFDVRWDGAKQFDVAIDAIEGETNCEGVTVPADATNVEVVEWTDTPAGFPMASNYPMYSLDGGDLVSNGTAPINGAANVTFHNRAIAEVGEVALEICKTVEDNEDGTADQGGTFRFDIRWDGAKQFDIAIDAIEGETNCDTVMIPEDATDVEVVEWEDTPADFDNDDGYPMYSLDGGDLVSNGTAAINGADNVTFHNRASGEVAGEVPLQICKTVEDNEDGVADQGGTFRFDVRWDGAKQFDIAIDAIEGETNCEGVTVPADATNVEVVEWTNTPADFPMASNYPMYSLDGGDLVSNGTAPIDGVASVTFHNRAMTEVAEVELQVCKTVEDNEDGVADQGGTFRFDIRWDGAKQFDIAIDAFEGDDPSCDTVMIPEDATNVEVVEWEDTPADFDNDDGYPMYSLDGGDLVSNGTAVIDGAESVTFHNRAMAEAVTTGELLVQKVGGEGNTFSFDVTDAGGDVMLNVPFGSAGTTIDLDEGSFFVTEDAFTNFTFTGWALAVEGACPASATGTDADIPVDIVAGEMIHLCIYNEAEGEVTTGSLFVQKVGGGANSFTFDLDDGIGGSVLTDVSFNATGSVTPLVAGSYVLVEDAMGGFTFSGWAIAVAGVCPSTVTSTTANIPVTIVAGQTAHLCIFNTATDGEQPPPPTETEGTLSVTKVGGSGNTFTFDISGDAVMSDVVFSATASTTNLEAGSYVVVEDDAVGYTYSGWALASAGVCPATPSSPDANIPVTIVAGETVELCIYNSTSAVSPGGPPGSLLVQKMGGGTNTFTYDISSGGAVLFSDVEFTGAGNVLALEPGSYVVTEDAFDGFVFTGWAIAGSGGCPDVPANTGSNISVSLTSGQTTHLCIYNSAVSPATPPAGGGGVSPTPIAPQTGSGLAGASSFSFMQLAAGTGLVLAGTALLGWAAMRRRST